MAQARLDPVVSSKRELVWDYTRGEVVDPETGEVVGEIAVELGPRAYNYEEFIERWHHAPMKPLRFRARDEVARDLREKLRRLHTRFGGDRVEKMLLRVFNRATNLARQLGLPVTPDVVERVVRAGHRILVDRGYCQQPKSCSRLLLAVVLRALQGLTGEPICREHRDLCHLYPAGAKPFDKAPLTMISAEAIRLAGAPARKLLITRWIQRICEELGRPGLAAPALRLLGMVRVDGLPARSVASALVYLAAVLAGDWHATQRRVAEAARCSTAAVRNGYRRFAKQLGIRIERYGYYGAVKAATAPKRICEELEAMGRRIAPYVVCR